MVMAAPIEQMFCIAVERILNGWTVLKLAVSHGMGGLDSQAKADWMVSAINQWFSENSDLEVYEVEEFLADVLNHEFDTIADDGSLKEVATMLCSLYSLCQSGQAEKVQEKLGQLPVASTDKCVQSTVICCDDDKGEIDEDVEETNKNTDPGDMQNDTKTEKMDTKETDEDGWQVVRRGKQKPL